MCYHMYCNKLMTLIVNNLLRASGVAQPGLFLENYILVKSQTALWPKAGKYVMI